MKRTDVAGNVTCYAYDALHRKTSVTYPSGPNAAATPAKHYVYDAATVNGVTMANAKGHLAEAYTGSSTAKVTDLGFSYSVRGEVTDVYEATPHSGGYYHVSAAYWSNGATKSLASNLTGLPTWTFGTDSEGRFGTVSASSGQNPVTATTYDGFGVTGITFGSVDSDSFSHDAVGRMSQYQYKVNGSAVIGTLTWNLNSTLQKLVITDPFITANNQTCNYKYDDLVRLTSANCGSVWGQTFSYDAFGNIAKSGSSSFLPTYAEATNRYSLLPGGKLGYDANGNVTADGFHNYSWDAEGKSTQIDPGANAVGMTYDALGRWVERGAGGGFTQNVYAPDGSELALTNGQTVAKAYLHLAGGAVVAYKGSAMDSYWHPDWLGTARLTSSPSRGVLGDAAYAPFGEQYVGPLMDNFFTGVAQSAEAADFKKFPARNYHTTEGRWLTPDPAGLAAVDLTNPQSLNRYAYVGNNPLSNIDPLGLFDFSVGNCYFNRVAAYVDGEFQGYDTQLLFCSSFDDQSPLSYASQLSPGGGGGGHNPPKKPTTPPKTGTNAPNACNGGPVTAYSVNATYSLSEAGAAVGSLAGPPGELIGYAIGSMFGAGLNASLVPSTNQWYVGPTVAVSPGFWGGTGVSVTRFSFPNQQSAGNVLSSWSASVNFQPTPLTGTTVTKSCGSPPVVGYTAGSRVPVAFSGGYNWLVWRGKCQ